MKIRLCPRCGTHNPVDNWYCASCGEILSVNTIVESTDTLITPNITPEATSPSPIPLSVSAAGSARINRVQRQQAERQVVCAILHASSFGGLYALIPSTIVWMTQRTISRFVAFQAIQAMLFQLLMAVATFGCLFIGFVCIQVASLIGRLGAGEAASAAFLVKSMMVAFGCAFFAQLILPLWGVWAAMQILRGHNYQYPILGRLAFKWVNQQPMPAADSAQSHRDTSPATRLNDSVLAGLSHLSILAGLSPILVPAVWATTKQRSQFLVHHLLQAPLVQIIGVGTLFALFPVVLGLIIFISLTSKSALGWAWLSVVQRIAGWAVILGWVAAFGLFFAIPLAAIIASIRGFQGKEFRYPVIGTWLCQYLDANK